MTRIKKPADLWDQLCKRAGLELRLKSGGPGRDADIEDAVRLALGVPGEATSLSSWLAEDAAKPVPVISTERLMVEVLQSQGGFALMMQDILDVLIKAQARQASNQLSVGFKFDKVSDPIKATLEQFRETVEQIQRVLQRRPILPGSEVMWELSGVLRRIPGGTSTQRPSDFPASSAIIASGNLEVDERLGFLSQLVSDFKTLWLRYGTTRVRVAEAARTMTPLLRGQLVAATDFWDIGVLAGAQALGRQVASDQLTSQHALDALDEALANVEWGERWVLQTIQVLLDLLKLPVWQRRHELYSVWVGTRMLDVVDRETTQLTFHAVDGVLSFEFGGSRLASFNHNGRQYDIWSELRSDLVGKSTKRKKKIQPDFRILEVQLVKSNNAQTTYVLECKHYLKAGASNFVLAATDYARTCSNATVHVVNHGAIKESELIAKLPVALQARTRFIGNATPSHEAATGALRKAIRQALFQVDDPSASSTATSVGHPRATKAAPSIGSAAVIDLTWDGTLEDIDLALEVLGPDGLPMERVDYKRNGALGAPPFARFDADVRTGPGRERIEIADWYFDRYALVVTNFSGTGQMTPDALQCTVVIGQNAMVIRPPVGLPVSCVRWAVAELHVTAGNAMVVLP